MSYNYHNKKNGEKGNKMRTLKAKELFTGDKMIIEGKDYTIAEIKKDGPQINFKTEGGLHITRNGETPVTIEERGTTPEPRIADMKTAAETMGIQHPKMTGNKLQETRAKDIKPGDRVKDGILGGDFFTIENVHLKKHDVFMTTTTNLSVHAQNEEIFLKEITPADDGETAAREETADFLEAAAKLEETEEIIKHLQMTIQEHAEEVTNATGKHQNDLMSILECSVNPEDLDQSAFYQDLETEIGEALNKTKEMNAAAQELRNELEKKERLEDFINEDN